MIKRWTIAAAAAALLASPAAWAQHEVAATPADEAALAAERARVTKVESALDEISAGNVVNAMAMLDPVLAEYDALYPESDGRAMMCDMPDEGWAAAGTAGLLTGKNELVLVTSTWCTALWAKGYTLVDVKRIDQALPYLERAVAMAPEHSHYLSELGYAYQALRLWDKSYAAYERAAKGAESYEGDKRNAEISRAWRGMGFVLIELGKLDEAEALFNKCLELDPDDAKARNELDYIAEQRAKAKS